MKTLSLTIAAIALAAAANLSPAAAQLQSPVAGYAAQTANNATPADVAVRPRYEWQYHYVGRHGRYEGHWVLVR